MQCNILLNAFGERSAYSATHSSFQNSTTALASSSPNISTKPLTASSALVTLPSSLPPTSTSTLPRAATSLKLEKTSVNLITVACLIGGLVVQNGKSSIAAFGSFCGTAAGLGVHSVLTYVRRRGSSDDSSDKGSRGMLGMSACVRREAESWW